MVRQFLLGFRQDSRPSPRHRRQGLRARPYPLPHQLEEAGYLRRIDRIVNEKARKDYAIEPGGDETMRPDGRLVKDKGVRGAR